MSTLATAILSEGAMPKLKKSRNPAINPPKITETMEVLAGRLIRSLQETREFTKSIEELDEAKVS